MRPHLAPWPNYALGKKIQFLQKRFSNLLLCVASSSQDEYELFYWMKLKNRGKKNGWNPNYLENPFVSSHKLGASLDGDEDAKQYNTRMIVMK